MLGESATSSYATKPSERRSVCCHSKVTAGYFYWQGHEHEGNYTEPVGWTLGVTLAHFWTRCLFRLNSTSPFTLEYSWLTLTKELLTGRLEAKKERLSVWTCTITLGNSLITFQNSPIVHTSYSPSIYFDIVYASQDLADCDVERHNSSLEVLNLDFYDSYQTTSSKTFRWVWSCVSIQNWVKIILEFSDFW